MSCKELTDSRINFKTELPARIGDFWLGRGSEEAKEIVRSFTRLSLQNNALSYIDHVEDLLSCGDGHINGLPEKVKLSQMDKIVKNFDPNNFHTTSHNGFPVEAVIPMRKSDVNREGVYSLDPETLKIWQDPQGSYWLWSLQKDPENVVSPYPEIFDVHSTVFMLRQPEYGVYTVNNIPTLILSKKGYLVYGLDFRVENGTLLFTEPLENLFDEYIHVVSSYQKRKTLLGFPFSVDPETPGVDSITKFLRQNGSAKNLEMALSQVAGFTSVSTMTPVMKQAIPEGTIIVGIDGSVTSIGQDVHYLENYQEGDFPGTPIRVISGTDDSILNFITTNSTFSIPTPIGPIVLQNKEYACVVKSTYVDIAVGDPEINIYFNTLRDKMEQIPRYDAENNLLPTFSEYLIDTFSPGAVVGDEFSVNLLRVYLDLFGYSVLLVLLSPDLNQEQRDAVTDFLQTHTPANAIIITDTLWESH